MDNLIETALSLLGMNMKDKITDYEGVVTSVSFDLAGCVQGLLVPKQPTAESDNRKCQWFDIKRLEPLGARVMDTPDFGAMRAGSETGPEPKPRYEGQPTPR